MGQARTDIASVTLIHQELLDAFNRRDWAAIEDRLAEDVAYTDHARGQIARQPADVVALYRSWADAFSDGDVDPIVFHQAGNVSVCQFIGRGTHDGQLGPFPPTGSYAATEFCEVLRSNDDGLIIGGDMYYDQLSMLTQLGLIAEPED